MEPLVDEFVRARSSVEEFLYDDVKVRCHIPVQSQTIGSAALGNRVAWSSRRPRPVNSYLQLAPPPCPNRLVGRMQLAAWVQRCISDLRAQGFAVAALTNGNFDVSKSGSALP